MHHMFRMNKPLISLFILFFFTACAAAQQPAEHNSVRNVLNVSGTERDSLVYKPAADASKRLPLMIVLHGGLGNAETMENTTGMDAVADSGQFVVAYPNGTGGSFAFMKDKRTWNAGACCARPELLSFAFYAGWVVASAVLAGGSRGGILIATTEAAARPIEGAVGEVDANG